MIVEGIASGMHRSPYAGYSVEFAQHRAYAPGDDLRHLDWKVFGRSDRLVVKQYQQETNLDLHLLLDVSGSMAYGSPWPRRGGRQDGQPLHTWRKIDAATTLAAAMALLAVWQGDRAGVLLFDPHEGVEPIRQSTRLAGGDEHWRALLAVLSAAQAREVDGGRDADQGPSQSAANLMRVVDQFVARTPRRGLVVLLSDLLDDTAGLERAMARLSHRGHDLLVIQTLDHGERTFPFIEPARFDGLEGEGRLGVDPLALRQTYRQLIDEHLAAVAQLARRFGFDHVLVDTSQPPGPALAQFLASRAARLARKGAS
jgi:uncharacterized protein (DUF58 family)